MITGLVAQAAGREESPDTTSQVEETRLKTGHHTTKKGNAPGNARGAVAPVLRFTESATEKIPPTERLPVIARRKTFGMSSHGTQRRQG